MELHLSLVTLLVLIFQALNGVHLQDYEEYLFPYESDNTTSLGITSSSVEDYTYDMDTTTIELSNSTNENTYVPVPNATIPGLEENGINSLSSPMNNDTAGNPAPTGIPSFTTNMPVNTDISGSNSTKASDTHLFEESNAMTLSPLNTTTNTSCANNSTEVDCTKTAAVTPESHHNISFTAEEIPSLPQPNSTSNISVASSSSTTNTTVASSSSTTKTTGLNTEVNADDSGNSKGNGGFASIGKNARNNSTAWGVIIGTALAVGFAGFVIYILLKRKNGQFMHRKLVEDIPSDPVLRLDNNEPLDLKFDGSAYYNPGLQGDHIQMTNFPQGHLH
ncbi:hypothetical protein GJAV_G00061950 [Gymnothorax javanicus]|nr:hypothetical protein GJAV_G00061950 [Gymnothorax javanicus]